MVYDHVARSIAPSFAGSSNSFPASINAGEDYISNFSFTLPADWDENNMHIIGMLMDPSGRIDNGSSTSISTAVDNGYELGPNLGVGEAFDFNIDDALVIYPNPAKEILNVQVELAEDTQYNIYSISGELVCSGILSSQNKTIKLPSLSKGLYIFQLQNKSVQLLEINN